MEYIDKAFAMAEAKKAFGEKGAKVISKVPKSDVIEVVRCKNCRYRFTRFCPMLTVGQDDGFCSRGKSYGN